MAFSMILPPVKHREISEGNRSTPTPPFLRLVLNEWKPQDVVTVYVLLDNYIRIYLCDVHLFKTKKKAPR